MEPEIRFNVLLYKLLNDEINQSIYILTKIAHAAENREV